MAELADAPALGAGASACRFDSCHPHQKRQISLEICRFLLFHCFLLPLANGLTNIKQKPTSADFNTALIKRDEYMVIMPVGHPLVQNNTVKIESLDGEPSLLLEHGSKTEVSALLEKSRVHPKIRFTTWEDFTIMAMAEQNLGIGILPSMILKRLPYKIEIRPLETPYYREIGIAVKDKARLTPATQKFTEYLKFREFSANNFL